MVVDIVGVGAATVTIDVTVFGKPKIAETTQSKRSFPYRFSVPPARDEAQSAQLTKFRLLDTRYVETGSTVADPS